MSQHNCYFCKDYKYEKEIPINLMTSVEDKKNHKEVITCEKCGNPYCETHSATYNIHSQIDYDCCERCMRNIEWRGDI